MTIVIFIHLFLSGDLFMNHLSHAMGHSTDMFSPDPAASCICAIFHDVLKHVSSLKECGHMFCEECIKTNLESNTSCPNFCAAVTGSNPNYFARDTIVLMLVRCPESKGKDHENICKKHKRDDNDVEDNESASASTS